MNTPSTNQPTGLPFSASKRALFIDQMSTETFDLVVIGGGITGAGIALDAATRGLKTALIEKRDFGWGTSSRSTKLIHGGLRYLKQFEFGLVHEVGVERAIVHHNARHVVLPEKMLLPIIEGGSLGKTLSSIGLWIYDRLAKVEKDERRQMFEKQITTDLEPLLRDDVLKGGGLYYEYRTDDARLTIETMKTAVEQGATCLNYIKATGFDYNEKGYVCGVHVEDIQTGNTFKIKTQRIVNAAGPWVDKVRGLDKEKVQGKRLHLTKGVHIVVPYERLPLKQSVYFDVNSDSRMCFAIPRFGVTYIGTTDTTYGEDINTPKATKEDVQYILDATNYMFPSVNLSMADVTSTWAGLRPLIHQDGKSPSELSRKDEIFYSKTGLISIAGGKLTGYRKMAERVVNFVCKTMRTKLACKTKELKVSGGQFESSEDLERFIELRTGEAKQIGLKYEDIRALTHKYGSNIDIIIEKAYELHPTIEDPQLRLHTAETWYVVEYEMSNNLCDYLIRRSGRLYFERPQLETLYPKIADIMADLLGWSPEQKQAAIEEFELEYKAVMEFRNGMKV